MLFVRTILSLRALCLLLLIALAGCSQQPVFHDSDGNAIRFADYKGQWIVINYWATWCKPCFKEMPELNKFYAAHNKNVVMFGVNYDYVSNDQLPALIKRIDAKFPTLTSDPAKALGVAHVSGLPATVIIDPAGRNQEILLGEQTQVSLEKALGLKKK